MSKLILSGCKANIIPARAGPQTPAPACKADAAGQGGPAGIIVTGFDGKLGLESMRVGT